MAGFVISVLVILMVGSRVFVWPLVLRIVAGALTLILILNLVQMVAAWRRRGAARRGPDQA